MVLMVLFASLGAGGVVGGVAGLGIGAGGESVHHEGGAADGEQERPVEDAGGAQGYRGECGGGGRSAALLRSTAAVSVLVVRVMAVPNCMENSLERVRGGRVRSSFTAR